MPFNLVIIFVFEEKNDEFKTNCIHDLSSQSQTLEALVHRGYCKMPTIADNVINVFDESRDFSRRQASRKKSPKEGVTNIAVLISF